MSNLNHRPLAAIGKHRNRPSPEAVDKARIAKPTASPATLQHIADLREAEARKNEAIARNRREAQLPKLTKPASPASDITAARRNRLHAAPTSPIHTGIGHTGTPSVVSDVPSEPKPEAYKLEKARARAAEAEINIRREAAKRTLAGMGYRVLSMVGGNPATAKLETLASYRAKRNVLPCAARPDGEAIGERLGIKSTADPSKHHAKFHIAEIVSVKDAVVTLKSASGAPVYHVGQFTSRETVDYSAFAKLTSDGKRNMDTRKGYATPKHGPVTSNGKRIKRNGEGYASEAAKGLLD